MFKTFFALFLLLIKYCFPLPSEEPCPCQIYDSQKSLESYCSMITNWAADVTVTNMTLGEYSYDYTINYTRIYKFPLDIFNETDVLNIYTKRLLSTCGREFPESTEYSLFGTVVVSGNGNGRDKSFGGQVWIQECAYLDKEFKEKLQNNSIICPEPEKITEI